MQKDKTYRRARFSGKVISEASHLFVSLLDDDESKALSTILRVSYADEIWEHDSEDEFFADIIRDDASYQYRKLGRTHKFSVSWRFIGFPNTSVSVEAPSRAEIESVFRHFEESLLEALLPES